MLLSQTRMSNLSVELLFPSRLAPGDQRGCWICANKSLDQRELPRSWIVYHCAKVSKDCYWEIMSLEVKEPEKSPSLFVARIRKSQLGISEEINSDQKTLASFSRHWRKIQKSLRF